MLLASLAFIYNELNDKCHWNNKELDVSYFALLDYLLVMIAGLVLYIYYEILPVLVN